MTVQGAKNVPALLTSRECRPMALPTRDASNARRRPPRYVAGSADPAFLRNQQPGIRSAYTQRS